jgi:hypothetical protein
VIAECPVCERPLESMHAAAQHAWKSQDDGHAHLEDLDEATLAVVDHNQGESTAPSPAEEPVVDEDGPDPSPTTPDGTVTDGGPRSPPSFATDDDVDDQDDGSDGCPQCGAEGESIQLLARREDVPDEVVAELREHGDRWCPDCSTAETAEVWES